MYIITEWIERYEVNDKGQPARVGDKLRVRPLEYIRSKRHGRSRSAGFAAMQRRAGDRAFEVFGLFHKFLEIAGDEVGGNRGSLLNARGKPATIKDLALILSVPEESIEFALNVLVDEGVGWIQKVSPENSRNSVKFLENQEIPGKSGNENEAKAVSTDNTSTCENAPENSVKFLENQEKSGGLYNETKRNETEQNETERNETLPESQGSQQNSQAGNNGDETNFGDFQSNSFSLRFVSVLEGILKTRSKSDRSAIRNLNNWLNLQVLAKRFDDGVFRRVADIANESKSGRNPLAVFFSRMDEEIGYRARVFKEKQK